MTIITVINLTILLEEKRRRNFDFVVNFVFKNIIYVDNKFEKVIKMNLTSMNDNLISKVIVHYFINTLNVLGSFLNMICVLIFYEIIKEEQNNQGHFYKYLFIKSISDCLFCLVNIPNIFYYTKDLVKSESFIMQVWYIVGYYYLYALFSQISIWFEICALIDCLCLISMKFQWHKSKLCFKIVTISITMIFLIFYIPIFFQKKIEKKLNGGYKIMETNFENSKSFEIHLIIHTALEVLLPFSFSLILNGFILWYIKKSTMHRQRIVDVDQVNNQSNRLVIRSINAEKNKIKMITFTSCMYVFHLPSIIFYLNIFNIKNNILFEQLSNLSFIFYFAIPILSYTAFNNTFRKYILKMIYKLFRL
jgi:hypothetical protein